VHLGGRHQNMETGQARDHSARPSSAIGRHDSVIA
jgi:hypothetical protein